MTSQPPRLPLTYLLRPARASEGKPPLLILLHGVGSNEHDLFSLAPELDERFILVSARAPITLGPGSYGWYPVEFTSTGMIIDADAAAESQRLLNRFIPEAVEALGADPRRVYLMGFSQGAIMSVNTMLTHPEQISGVVAMSGRLLNELKDDWVEPERLRGFPVMVVHGLYDQVIPIAMGREVRDTLAQLPVDLTYKEYPMPHTISIASLNDIQAWLRARLAG